MIKQKAISASILNPLRNVSTCELPAEEAQMI